MHRESQAVTGTGVPLYLKLHLIHTSTKATSSSLPISDVICTAVVRDAENRGGLLPDVPRNTPCAELVNWYT